MLLWAGDRGKNPHRPIHGPRSLTFALTHRLDLQHRRVQTVISQIQSEQSAQFNSESLVPYTIDGVQYGTFKTAGNLSFLNVFESGHEIPAFRPSLALRAFIQTMSQQPLSST